jgi:hypothetical protein
MQSSLVCLAARPTCRGGQRCHCKGRETAASPTACKGRETAARPTCRGGQRCHAATSPPILRRIQHPPSRYASIRRKNTKQDKEMDRRRDGYSRHKTQTQTGTETGRATETCLQSLYSREDVWSSRRLAATKRPATFVEHCMQA